MLRRMKDMEGYSISALDGVIGEIKDYYFDDVGWVIRYLVVETGDWLASRRVLISPAAINGPDWSEKSIPAAMVILTISNFPMIGSRGSSGLYQPKNIDFALQLLSSSSDE